MMDREPFSARYDMIRGVDVVPYGGDHAIMEVDLYHTLEMRYGFGLVGRIDGLHYEFLPEGAIPADTVAVPADQYDERSTSTLLILK